MQVTDPTLRFSDTVEYYAKYRPSYPPGVLRLLTEKGNLKSGAKIADIGAGTGLFSELLLDTGYAVTTVEANAEMCAKSNELLAGYPQHININAPAEATGLDDNSVDCITVAMAFHWFDSKLVAQEFRRILKTNGFCLLLWNIRDITASDFMRDYEQLLQSYGTDYHDVGTDLIKPDAIEQLFTPAPVASSDFVNHQLFDEDGLIGRLRSSSFMPKPDQAKFVEMIDAAKSLFNKHQKQNQITFTYRTRCLYANFID